MALRSWPERALRGIADSPVSERVSRVEEQALAPLVAWVRRTPLHTDVLGHSVHPFLTDMTTGSWLSASLLDLAGGAQSRHAATLLTGFGLLASLPTALAGAADLADLPGPERRIGGVHALSMGTATLLFAGSLVARLGRRHGLGAVLAGAGNTVLGGAAFLGGHLALHQGTARRPFRG